MGRWSWDERMNMIVVTCRERRRTLPAPSGRWRASEQRRRQSLCRQPIDLRERRWRRNKFFQFLHLKIQTYPNLPPASDYSEEYSPVTVMSLMSSTKQIWWALYSNIRLHWRSTLESFGVDGDQIRQIDVYTIASPLHHQFPIYTNNQSLIYKHNAMATFALFISILYRERDRWEHCTVTSRWWPRETGDLICST